MYFCAAIRTNNNIIMKKFVLSLAMMLLGAMLYAQEPYRAYCMITTSGKILQRGDIEVFIDFGQQINWNPAAHLVDLDTGKDLKFNSMVNALNYLSKRGWQVQQMIDEKIIFLYKEVINDSQITEGLMTGTMYEDANRASKSKQNSPKEYIFY